MSPVRKKKESTAMSVTTDAVHHRLTGSPKRKILPPKHGTSANNSQASSRANSSTSLNGLGERQDEEQASNSVTLNREKSTSSTSIQSHSSSNSLNQENHTPVDVPQELPGGSLRRLIKLNKGTGTNTSKQ